MRMNKGVIIFVFISCLFLKAYGWGEQGHKIVAAVAKKTLSKSIADSVQFYLGTMSFKDASLWMDKIKRDKKYRYMNTWHYINIEKDAAYQPNNEAHILNKLNEYIQILKNRKKHSQEEIRMALKIVFHLVGDIHQPLHCGYASDKGGNSIKVDFMGRDSNLHRVWDSDIIQYMKIGIKDCYASANAMNEKEKKQLQQMEALVWMKESHAILPEVYSFPDNIISMPYLNKNTDTIKSQLVKAGIRLGYILHECFK